MIDSRFFLVETLDAIGALDPVRLVSTSERIVGTGVSTWIEHT